MWKFKTPGIPDEEFIRKDDVPITKEEIRTLQISKGRLRPGYIVYDVGCGSGSISIEAALQVESTGKVYSIDHDPMAIELTNNNVKKFEISNVSVILADAKDEITKLPDANVIFIGGTGGDTIDILKKCNDKLKSGGRIVIGVILIETLYAILKLLDSLDFSSIDISQVTISKSRKTSTGTMMLARNPVTIISATKNKVSV